MRIQVAGIRAWWTLLVVAFLQAGCETVPSNRSLHDSADLMRARSDATRSVVIGRIEWREHGEQQATKVGPLSTSFAPAMLRMGDKTRIVGGLESDGRFAWSLQPGKYFLYKMAYHDAWSGEGQFNLKYAFNVPRAGEIYYVGMLEVKFTPKRKLLGELIGSPASFAVRDMSDRDLPEFQRSLNLPLDEVHKSLMVWNSSLPAGVDTNKELTQVNAVMDAMFGGVPSK